MNTKDNTEELLPSPNILSETIIENQIYNIRGKQVMLDSDVAFYFRVETGQLNRQMQRNKNRFPEEFCFKLNSIEFKSLMCQNGISNRKNLMSQNAISNNVDLKLQNVTSKRGGKHKLPYVYTEHGIIALAGVIKSKVAAEASVKIVRQFVEMRHFLLSNGHLLESLSTIQNRQIKFEDETNEKFDLVFKKIEHVEIPKENIFFKGEFFDAYDFIIKLINKAQTSILLIDPYCDEKALSFFKSKKKEIELLIVKSSNAKLSDTDVERYSSQYGSIKVINNDDVHDRFLIIDQTECYSLGTSLNYLGNKTIVMTQIESQKIIQSIIDSIK